MAAEGIIMRGEVPKVGDTIPAMLADEKVSAKVNAVKHPVHNLLRNPGTIIIEVHADEV
jgi:hypothetical protein